MMHSERLRALLVDHRDPPDVGDIVLPNSAGALPADWLSSRVSAVRVAAILVPFVMTESGLQVLLTERAPHLRHHPGQISFPGGAQEPEDDGLAATALRETEEEIGIHREQIEVLGYLRPQWTISNYSMTPVIGLVHGRAELTLDPDEVASAFSVPASHLFDRTHYRRGLREVQGVQFETIELAWEQHRIWGATATVIDRLSNVLKNSGLK